ncbi:hypothetical protein T484DRAFT_2685031 [Baffinella frigidus]|nr:hypothetical protein T484DRAFT_2685031 [Cryptophyta sp. CCMP2293]
MKTTDGMAYFSLLAELEALEKAAAARGPRYMQKFGASDEVFYAKMRLALQSIKPASDCTEGEPAGDLRDRVTHLPFAEAPHQPQSRRSSISASECLSSVNEGEWESAEDVEKRFGAADDPLFTHFRHALETANQPHDHAAPPPPYRVTSRQSRQSPFSSPRTASPESTSARHGSLEANEPRRFDSSPGVRHGKAHPFAGPPPTFARHRGSPSRSRRRTSKPTSVGRFAQRTPRGLLLRPQTRPWTRL